MNRRQSTGSTLKELRLINNLVVTITDAEPFSDLMDIFVVEVLKIFNAAGAFLTRFDREKRTFRLIRLKVDDEILLKVSRIFDPAIRYLEYPSIPKRFNEAVKNKVTVYRDLKEAFAYVFSERQSAAFRDQIGVRKIVRLTLNHSGEILGDLYVFLYSGQSLPSVESMKLITNIACVTVRRQEAEESLSSAITEQKNLLARLVKIREDERAGIAKDIHDELGQNLTALKLNISLISTRKKMIADEAVKARLDASLKILDSTIQFVKRISQELRPWILDESGFVEALKWQAGEFSRSTGIPCSLSLIHKDTEISREISLGLFRIVQEALTNISRHAKAAGVSIELKLEGKSLELTITDDGIGIKKDILKNSWSPGLAGMRERARLLNGELDISSFSGRGTSIKVTVPVS